MIGDNYNSCSHCFTKQSKHKLMATVYAIQLIIQCIWCFFNLVLCPRNFLFCLIRHTLPPYTQLPVILLNKLPLYRFWSCSYFFLETQARYSAALSSYTTSQSSASSLKSQDPFSSKKDWRYFLRAVFSSHHLIRINLIMTGHLRDRPLSLDRFQCHSCFEIVVVTFTFPQ